MFYSFEHAYFCRIINIQGVPLLVYLLIEDFDNLYIKELQLLGYQALAVGHFEDDLQVAYTTDLAQLMEQAYVESIRAAMINGNFFFL